MDAIEQAYHEQGYVLLPGVVPADRIDALLARYMGLVREVTGRPFAEPNGADLIEFYNRHPDVESRIYTEIRRHPWLEEFSQDPRIVGPVARLLGGPLALFRKIPFRIDMPHWTAELALWHQDFHYVRGNTRVVTAWVPLQDTNFLNGCLSIMPGSHRLGPVPHDLAVGKKRVPRDIFGNPIRLVEMRRGDLLLFNALLLHSGNLNLSAGIRYSVQARYTRLGDAVDEGMGGLIPLTEDVA